MKIKKIIVCFFLITIFFNCNKTKISDGKIIFLAGNVTVNGHKAKLHEVITAGYSVQTADNSYCEIVFNEKNIIRLSGRSHIIYNISGEKSVINVYSGSLAGVLKRLTTKDGEKLSIISPTTIAAIRGTSFYIKVENPQNTYFCDCNGIIELFDINKIEKKEIKALHHKAYNVILKNNKTVFKKAQMLYHRDKDIEGVAKKIGVTIDWTKID